MEKIEPKKNTKIAFAQKAEEQSSKSQDNQPSYRERLKFPHVIQFGGHGQDEPVGRSLGIKTIAKNQRHNDCLPRLAYTIQETAEILGISQRSVRRLLERKLLHSSLALRKKLIPATEITRFLQATTSKEDVCQ